LSLFALAGGLSALAFESGRSSADGIAATPPSGGSSKANADLGDTAELSFVTTSGNSDATTLGLRTILRRRWERSRLRVELGSVLSRSRADESFGVGSLEEFEILEPPQRTDAERLYIKNKFERSIQGRLFWFTGLDAEPNDPADIEERYTASGGVGNTWVESKRVSFSTSYGLSLSREKLTNSPRDDFGGYRVSYDLSARLTETTAMESSLDFNGNVEEGPDYRIDAENAVTVAVSERLAVKASLQANFRNRPAKRSIVIYDIDPSEPPQQGATVTVVGNALVDNDELDTTFSTSLVFSF
jgi:putative salt-induced outer membrane protein YdiY